MFKLAHPDLGVDDYLTFKALTAMDDWSSIAATAIPYILKNGPKAISYLYNKFYGS